MTKFMVQWEDHPSHLATRLGHLLEHQTLVDVTLMCNTHTLRVHRAVLAAGSPYFETILSRQLGQHPLIVLKDMQFNVLKSLIEFMYCGETSVTEDNLPALLQAAKFFQVRGLSSMTKEALGLTAETTPPSLSIQGQPNPPSRPTTKRVNIQSLKSNNTTNETQRMTFHTVAKTIPSKMRNANTADNAQLLLALSESDPTNHSLPSTSRSTVPASRGTVPAKSPAALGMKQAIGNLQAKPPFNRNYKKSPNTTPDPAANVVGPKKRRYSKKKPVPCYTPKPKVAPSPQVLHPAIEGMTRGVLYQDPETNIIYQLEEPVEEPVPEPEVPVEDEDVIYQLADGTITDQHGNPLLDKDGNQQNISSYQLASEAVEPTQEGDPYDMPILLDNGDGQYTAAPVATDAVVPDGDLIEMSVEQALEEMMGDSATDDATTSADETATVYSSTQPSILEETLRGTYSTQRSSDQLQSSVDQSEPGFIAVDAQLDSEQFHQDNSQDFTQETFTGEGAEQEDYVTEATEAEYVNEGTAETEFVTDGTEQGEFVNESADFVAEGTDNEDFATEEANFAVEGTEQEDFTTNGTEQNNFAGEEVDFSTGEPEADFTTGENEADFTTGETETDFTTGETEVDYTTGETEADFTTGETEADFTTGETETDFTTGETEADFNTGETEADFTTGETEADFTAGEQESDFVLDGRGKVGLVATDEDYITEDHGKGSNGVDDDDEGKIVCLGSSSLLKNALQKSGIDLDSLAPQFADMKPAVTYQISQVDGKQNVRLVNVGNDSTVITPPKDLLSLPASLQSSPPELKRRASSDTSRPAKRMMLDDDLGADD